MKRDPTRTHRRLRRSLRRLLVEAPLSDALREMQALPARQAVNPLIGFLCDREERVRWRAVALLGRVVAGLAEAAPESARVVMRRLMWSLNDESGGIGWGAPEAMGAILARSPLLAREYTAILVSYVRPDGNYLEHPGLQRGLLWGLARLGQARPKCLGGVGEALAPFLSSPDPAARGLAAWAARAMGAPFYAPFLAALAGDDAPVRVYVEDAFHDLTVGHMAAGRLPAPALE
jgi:HEAT repeat protein